MANFATLVLGVDSRQMVKGEKALKETTREARKTERAVDKTGTAFVKTGAQSKASTAAMTAGMKAAALAAAALALAAIGIGKSVGVIRDFEASVSKMGAISGATTSQLQDMRDVAKDLGSTTEFSATQAADGLSFLAMAGFDAAESIAAIPAVLDLATAAGMGLAEAADTASNIMSGFGIAASDASGVTDILAAASTRANTNVAQLGAAMSMVAPIASALDISLADTAAAIGVMSDAGIQGERAGTALRGVLASLAGPTSQASDVLKNLGLSLADVDPAANSLADIMAKLDAAGLSTADAMAVFGREAASGALVMVEGASRLRDFGAELGNVEGAAKAMAGTMRDNLGGDIKGLVSALSGLAIALGEAGITKILRGAIQVMTDLARIISGSVVPIFQTLALVLAGLLATQIPMVIAGFVSMTAGMTAAGVATGIFTGAVNIARAAVIALGGPLGIVWGILGAGAAAWVLWGEKAGIAGAAAYDAATGTIELNAALHTFSQEVTPAAAASAIDVANANHQLASSAFEAAEATLAQSRAMLQLLGASANEVAMSGRRAAQIAPAQAAYTRALDQQAAAEKLLALAVSERKNAVTQVTGALSEQMTQTIAAVEVIDDLADSLAGSGGVVAATEDFNSTMQDAAMTMEEMGVASANVLIGGIDAVANAFGNWMANGFKDFKGFARSMLDTFKSMLSQMIAMAVKNKILISLGFGGSVTGGIAQAAGGIGGAAGGAAGALGSLGSLLSVAGNSFMTTLGAFGSGLTAGFGQIGATLAGATSSISGFAAAAGAVAVPLLAAVAIFSFFKKKTKELDAGMKITTSGMDTMVESFRKVQTSRFFGLQKRTSTNYTTEASGNPLEQAVGSIQSSVLAAADALGLGAKSYDAFRSSITISTKGLSEADAQQAITDALNGFANEFANFATNGQVQGIFSRWGGALRGALGGMIGNIIKVSLKGGSVLDAFALEGEGAYETLTRLATSLQSVNATFDMLGLQMFQVSIAGGGLAANLVELFGGLDQFNTSISQYYELFYSEQERAAILTGQLTTALGGMNLAMPETRDAYRDLIEAQDLNTVSGQEAFAMLVSLSGQFDTVLPRIEDTTGALSDLSYGLSELEEIERERMGIQRQIWLLLGDTNSLREDELANLHASNRGLQNHLYALRDEKEAADAATKAIQDMIDAISPEKFATIAGYNLAIGRANSGQGASRTTSTGVSLVSVPQEGGEQNVNTSLIAELRALRTEVANFKEESRGLAMNANSDIRKMRINSDKDQAIGIPAERAAGA